VRAGRSQSFQSEPPISTAVSNIAGHGSSRAAQYGYCFEKRVTVLSSKNSGYETLANAFDPSKNAFGFLRFALAALVVFSHCYPLGGFGPDPLALFTTERLSLGLFAVALFFVLSGFLITRSALRTPMGRFLWHRFLRIFPGYWVCLAVCAFILAPIIYQIEYAHGYRIFTAPHDSPQAYLAGNFAMLHLNEWSIGGVMKVCPLSIGATLHSNPYPFIFNGSIWTLPFELVCYLGVAALTLLGIIKRARRVLLFVFVLGCSLYAFNWLAPVVFQEFFPFRYLDPLLMLSLYFLGGALCFLYREEIPFSPALLLLAALLLAGGLMAGWFGVIAPLALPYLFLWLACKLPVQRFDARGDYSYGLYMYAFPIQQTLVFFHLQAAGFWTYFFCALLLSTLFGILSFRLIEAPCLRFKNADPRALIAKFRAKRQPVHLAAPPVESTSH
jgi:peptidoglycan/LPS O-acetylase OafA/YrhL